MTFCFAITALFTLRINSSVFPLNIDQHMSSIDPGCLVFFILKVGVIDRRCFKEILESRKVLFFQKPQRVIRNKIMWTKTKFFKSSVCDVLKILLHF